MQPTCLVAEFEAPLDLLGLAASQTQAAIAGPLLNVSGLVEFQPPGFSMVQSGKSH